MLLYLLAECAYYYENYQQDGTPIIVHNEFPHFSFSYNSNNKEDQCLLAMVDQILSEKYYSFLQGIFLYIKDNRLNYLVNYLNAARKDCFISLSSSSSEFTGNYRDDFVFRTMIATPEVNLTENEDFRRALSDYVSNHPTFLNKEHFEDAKLHEAFGIENYTSLSLRVDLIKRFEILKICFSKIDYNKANTVLFDKVYNNHLYNLNFKNINHLFIIKYGLEESDDFKHKNYSLLKTIPDSPLAIYVENNINYYLTEILANCENKISDNESSVLEIINNDDISVENKNTYISVLTTIIQNISRVEDKKLWEQLISTDIVAHTEQNVFDYFCACEYTIQKELIQFINSQNNVYNYNNIKENFDKDIQSKFFVAVLQCNELANNHYHHIIKTLNRNYNNGFNVSGISNDKIIVLIEIDIIPMHINSLLFMREHYPKAVLPYINKYIKQYLDIILDDKNFNINESLKVLSLSITDKYKLDLIAKIKTEIVANNQNFSDNVRAYILEHNLDSDEIEHFIVSYSSEGKQTKEIIEKITINNIEYIFQNKHTINKKLVDKLLTTEIDNEIKLKLFALILPTLNEEECKKYLTQLSLDNYAMLFEKKRPTFEKTTINDRLLMIFKDKNWITKYEEDNRDNKLFRAYGRNLHSQKSTKKVTKKLR